MWIASSLSNALTPTIAALGNFDGLHQGHIQVIQPTLCPASPPYSTVVTFTPHPQEFFTGQPKALLTPLLEKIDRLQALGIEQLVLLPFNRELANLSPEEFVQSILIQALQVQGISVGQDFCFGRGRRGTAEDLRAIAAQHQIPTTIVSLEYSGQERISSSAIRQALAQGNLTQANQLLGRPYRIEGTVVQGQQLGRTLGFPTANLKLPPEKFIPCHGVYGVWVTSPHVSSLATPQAGVMNIGVRPTVSGQGETIEVHLLQGSPDLYGQVLRVELVKFLRPEQKFESIEALKRQIHQDCEQAHKQLTGTPIP